jgi:hypothetical protein
MLDKPEEPALDTMVENYVRVRDRLKEADEAHKRKTAEARQWMEDQNLAILGRLQAIGVDNVKTKHGTAYRTVKKSATVADGSVFRKFVIDNSSWDLIDVRANAPAVSAWIKAHETPPPGVNYTETEVVGVRRASET